MYIYTYFLSVGLQFNVSLKIVSVMVGFMLLDSHKVLHYIRILKCPKLIGLTGGLQKCSHDGNLND